MTIAIYIACIAGFAAVFASIVRATKAFERLFGDDVIFVGLFLFGAVGAGAAGFVPFGPVVEDVPIVAIAAGALAGIFGVGGAVSLAMR